MTECAPETISLIIADNHRPFLAAVRDFLLEDNRVRVLAEVADGADALGAIRRHQPKVAVLDLEMPGLSGLAVARAVRDSGLPTAVVLLTMHKDEHVIHSALEHGVSCYILKDDLGSHLLPAIEAALGKRPYFSPQLLTPALRAIISARP